MSDEWMRWAPCGEVGGDLWFPDVGKNVDPRAKDICDRCPYKDRCVSIALSISPSSLYGMWGGMTPNQINRLRRSRQAVAA